MQHIFTIFDLIFTVNVISEQVFMNAHSRLTKHEIIGVGANKVILFTALTHYLYVNALSIKHNLFMQLIFYGFTTSLIALL